MAKHDMDMDCMMLLVTNSHWYDRTAGLGSCASCIEFVLGTDKSVDWIMHSWCMHDHHQSA